MYFYELLIINPHEMAWVTGPERTAYLPWPENKRKHIWDALRIVLGA